MARTGGNDTASGAAVTQPLDPPSGVNEVRLSGRLAAEAAERDLPSGDAVVQLRLVVRRPPGRAGVTGSAAVVDTIDLACWTPVLRRRALALRVGDIVEIEGSLRRRFWRGPAGPASRYEVEVASLRRTSTSTSSAPARSRSGAVAG